MEQNQNNAPEELPAHLKLQLLMAEKEIEEKMPGKLFNTYNAVLTGVLCFIAFFVCGFFARAPLGSSIGFAVIGGIVGVLVGGYRKTAPPAK